MQFERVDISDTILALTQILTDGALILYELRKVVCILRHTMGAPPQQLHHTRLLPRRSTWIACANVSLSNLKGERRG